MTSVCFREDLVDELSEEIASCLDGGCAVASVLQALTELSSELSDDERASLWLFTCCYGQGRGVREELARTPA